MNPNPRFRDAALLALCAALILCTPAAWAQEEAEEDEGRALGSVRFLLEGWIAQPTGLEYSPAAIQGDNPLGNEQIFMDYGTNDEFRYRLEWQLPNKIGSVDLTLFRHDDTSSLEDFAPGNFIFNETLAHGVLAGVDNDRRADAYISGSSTRLRDWRLDFRRAAVRTPKFNADWHIGWRRVDHDRDLFAAYFATIPDFPAVLPPSVPCTGGCPDLAPLPDSAQVRSSYEGRGVSVGVDLDFPFYKNKFVFEGGATFTVMRGKTDSFYEGNNHYYLLDLPPSQPDSDPRILQPPYDEFDDSFFSSGVNQAFANFITQEAVGVGLKSSSVETSSDVLEAYVGFRWKALKWLDVQGGFRQARYNGVGIDLVPQVSSPGLDENFDLVVNIDSVTEVDRSATYEGFYGGLVIRLY